MAQHALYDAIFSSGSPVNLRQIMGGGWRANSTAVYGFGSAGVDPQEIYAGRADPVADFSSADLVTVLTSISPSAGLFVTDGITVPFQKRASGGTFVAGSVNWATAATRALIVPTELTAQRDDEGEDTPGAVVTLEAHPESADGFDPVSASTGNALQATDFNGQFTMGSVYVNLNAGGLVELVSATGIRVSTGIDVRKVYRQGLLYPIQVSIRRRQPTIEVDIEDMDTLSGISFDTLTALDCYLFRRVDGAAFADGASTVHGKISFGAGLHRVDQVRASGTNDASATLVFHGKQLTWSANNALPA